MSAPAIAAPARERADSFSFPWLPFVPLLLLPFAGTEPETVSRTIVAMEMLFLVMAIRNPVWILGALLLSELSVRNYFLEIADLQISTRLFISLTAVVLVLPRIGQGATIGPRGKSMALVAGAFIAIATLANALASDASYVAQFFRYILTGFIAMIVIPLVVESRKDLAQLATVALVVGAASAIAAIMQHYHFRGAPIIAVVPNSVFETGFEAWQGRSLGLAENPVYLTSDLLFVLVPLVAVILTRGAPERFFLHLALLVLTIALALYFTQTRSWLVAAVPAIASMGLLLAPKMGRDLIFVVVVLAGAFWLWSEHAGNRYSLGPDEDDSAATRPVLWTAALNIARDNPVLGVGHDQFLELSPEYADTIDRGLLEQQNAGAALGRFTPHNDYLNVWLSFGTGALVLYVLILSLTWFNLRDAFRALDDALLKGLALGGAGALVAFAINSFFHNFFDSTLTLWVLAGLSLALIKLADTRQQADEYGQ